MAGAICSVPECLSERLKQFRFRKSAETSALILRINKDQLLVEEEEFLESTSLRQLADEYLPETQPRYIVISYQYNSSDGRSSQPLIFIYWSPLCVKPETHMLYAGAKMHVVQVCECSGKCYEVRDLDQFNDEWMHEKLAFFR